MQSIEHTLRALDRAAAEKRGQIGRLAKTLADYYAQAERPFEHEQRLKELLDMTALQGVYDFTLDYAPDDSAAADDGPGPSIFTALQEQLGLKLEPCKGPVEVLVVDRAEKPSQN